jgi:septum site-determining protein MinC
MAVSIKGGKEGLRLVLDETAPWSGVLDDLRLQLERGVEFFHGAQLIVDTGERMLGEAELGELLQLMGEHGLQPNTLATSSREARTAGRAAGITTRPPQRPSGTPATSQPIDSATLVQRTLRSGQIFRFPGHVTIIGDVNPGAEIIASGSVVVWGRVRGTVWAGALGDTSAVVCALELTPTSLQIADVRTRPPDTRPAGPEIAHLTSNGIEVEPWENTKR